MIDGREMLVGPLSIRQLFFDYPEWKKLKEAYQPDSSIIRKLKKIDRPFQVEIFMATWCPDSKREVPHFLKIIDRAHLNKKAGIKMYALNRKLKMDNDLPEQYGIKRVATFIFLRDGKELGRIVERPQSFLLEEDILTILNK